MTKLVQGFNKLNELVKGFTANNKILNVCELKQDFIDSLPRLWLEWLVIIGFILLMFLMIFQGKELLYAVPLLGLFAAAAFRLMPSLARIMNAIQGILYNRPAIDSVYEEFNQENSRNTKYLKS